jgi:hypothetical protein
MILRECPDRGCIAWKTGRVFSLGLTVSFECIQRGKRHQIAYGSIGNLESPGICRAELDERC